MKKIKRIIFVGMAACLACCQVCGSLVSAADGTSVDKAAQLYRSAKLLQGDTITYSEYLSDMPEYQNTNETVELTAENALYKGTNASNCFYDNYEGKNGRSVLLEENCSVSWEFTVSTDGFYGIDVSYFPFAGYGSPILADLLIDGKLPFRQCAELTFSRIWNNGTDEIQKDAYGNEILPGQIETPRWTVAAVCDSTGYVGGGLKFGLRAGKHTVTLCGKRDRMLINSLKIYGVKAVKTYAQVEKEYQQKGYPAASKEDAVCWQAESASAKSDQMLFPLSDRSSPTVYPYSAAYVRYNTIGGSQWKTAGQWLEWEVEVKTSGLYAIAAHFKQALKSGNASVRKLTIDGELPFAEAENWCFPYGDSWQERTFSDKQGNPYAVYLTKGKHTVRLQIGLGESAEILSLATDYLSELNRIYREIVVVTGVTPDLYRSYDLEKMIPETLKKMKESAEKLQALEKLIAGKNSGSGKNAADVKRLYIQLNQMVKDYDTIPARLSGFKDNVASFGTWINTMAEQPLELDTLSLLPAGTVKEGGEAGFFTLAGHYIKQFLYSFVTDYAMIGKTDDRCDREVTVWMTSGRDQAQVLKSLVNSDFTVNHNISVDLQLVSANSLMSAILAGIGPDVSLGVTQDTPMNLALRNAVTDLTKFEDYDEIAARFGEDGMTCFTFGKGVYALPETQSYPMLFYRKDILGELGIEPESLETWDSIMQNVLPTLKKRSLSFGFLPSLQHYLIFLYQRGGNLYNDGGRRSGLSSAMAIDAMEEYAMLYTQYGLSLSYDFANRFRSGEVPVAVTEFTAYNQLTVFAPEIKGVWGMLPVPGFQTGQGIDHTACVTLTADILLASAKDKAAAWEFLKWWTSAETQTVYGKSIESIVGSAARYNSANAKAFSSVQWDSDMKENLMFQQRHVRVAPEVPGSYITGRLYDFAFRDIVYQFADVRETMNDTAFDIDREMTTKREEYGLD